jgi:hypothetical protein
MFEIFFIKSLPSSLFQREEKSISLSKGKIEKDLR